MMMSEATQYTIAVKDLMELLIKKHNINEGLWVPTVGMKIGSGQFGSNEEEPLPGAYLTFSNFGIQKIDPSSPRPPNAIAIDAAKVNPAKSTKKRN